MPYRESIEQTEAAAAAALERMRALAVPCNPHNFTVWYEYFSGANPDLKRTIDSLVEQNEALTPARHEELFNSFIARGSEAEDFGGRIEVAADQILKALATMGDDAEAYSESLHAFSGGLAGAQSVTEVQRQVRAIVERTATMNRQIDTLRQDVGDSTCEIAELRQKLEEARRDAQTDGLTGIANRKCFDETLRRAAAHAEAAGAPLSLAMTDIDHFKRFNDTHGHPVGDQVLKLVAQTLVQNIKGRDTAARFGGEEFVLILPETDAGGAAMLAERIRAAVAVKRLYKRGEETPLGSITLSLGVATYRPGESLDALVRRADEALYLAKRSGRNRVATEGDIAVANAARQAPTQAGADG